MWATWASHLSYQQGEQNNLRPLGVLHALCIAMCRLPAVAAGQARKQLSLYQCLLGLQTESNHSPS